MNNLQKLNELGQSPWYDNISRDLLDGGDIQRLVDQGVRGMTSNPAIFKAAIAGSTAYDEQLRGLLGTTDIATDVYEALAIEDIQRACDILMPVFEASNHVDGFVSLEVSPLLATNTQATIDEAQRLREWVNRPNVFIKIPATSEGIPAIEECLYRGYPVNITLIFSRKVYDHVMEAYLRAMERRTEEGKDLREVRSVASFFVSRVDSLVDGMLQKMIDGTQAGNVDQLRELVGKAGIANAKLAYKDFSEKFGTPRYQEIEKMGALVQRPLWASTSTKNPAYPDTLYVDNLIGADTVNTMPGETIEAFLDHGKVALTIEEDIDGAQRVIEALEGVGISMDAVTQQLLDEGVAKFAQPFEALLSAIDQKLKQMVAAS